MLSALRNVWGGSVLAGIASVFVLVVRRACMARNPKLSPPAPPTPVRLCIWLAGTHSKCQFCDIWPVCVCVCVDDLVQITSRTARCSFLLAQTRWTCSTHYCTLPFWPSGVRLCHLLCGFTSLVTKVTMGGDLQPGCLADRLLTGLSQPQINP